MLSIVKNSTGSYAPIKKTGEERRLIDLLSFAAGKKMDLWVFYDAHARNGVYFNFLGCHLLSNIAFLLIGNPDLKIIYLSCFCINM